MGLLNPPSIFPVVLRSWRRLFQASKRFGFLALRLPALVPRTTGRG